VSIVGIGPGGERGAAVARRTLGLGYPLLADRGTQLAKRFGFRRLLGLLQESGVAVIDAAGTVRMLHRTANPGAALPSERVRATLRAIAARSGPPATRDDRL
jgi:peroxiredoxin